MLRRLISFTDSLPLQAWNMWWSWQAAGFLSMHACVSLLQWIQHFQKLDRYCTVNHLTIILYFSRVFVESVLIQPNVYRTSRSVNGFNHIAILWQISYVNQVSHEPIRSFGKTISFVSIVLPVSDLCYCHSRTRSHQFGRSWYRWVPPRDPIRPSIVVAEIAPLSITTIRGKFVDCTALVSPWGSSTISLVSEFYMHSWPCI